MKKIITKKKYFSSLKFYGTLKDNYFPRGIGDFKELRNGNYFFVDNTEAIYPIISMQHPFVFRPARMGKTMMTNALEEFVDVLGNKEIFKGTKIDGINNEIILQYKNQCQVLRLSLQIAIPTNLNMEENIKELKSNFNKNIASSLVDFCLKYNYGIDDSKYRSNSLVDPNNPLQSLQDIAKLAAEQGNNLYIVIDEVDNVANNLLFSSLKFIFKRTGILPSENSIYKHMVVGIKGDQNSSLLRQLFATIKNINDGSKLRLFNTYTTGIMSVSGISTGNIFTDISDMPSISNYFGFPQEDIKRALMEIFPGDDSEAEREHLFQIMKANYDGYKFAGSNIHLFNSDLSIFFLDQIHRDENIRKKVFAIKDPSNPSRSQLKLLMDPNSRIKENTLNFFASIPLASDILEGLKYCQNLNMNPQTPTIDIPQFDRNKLVKIASIPDDDSAAKYGLEYDTIVTKPFDLDDIYAMDEYKYTTTQVDKVLSLCYFFGITTFASINNRKTMCFSNNLIFRSFSDQVELKRTPLSIRYLSDILRNPNNIDSLKNSFLLMMRNEKVDNRYSEAMFQSHIEDELKKKFELTNIDFKFTIPSAFYSKKKYKEIDISASSIDIDGITSEYKIILELKVIRPNAVILPNFKADGKKDNEWIEWLDSDYSRHQKMIDDLSEDRLLELEIGGDFASFYKGSYDENCLEIKPYQIQNVDGVVKNALRQAIHYATNSINDSKTRVFVYAVVLLGKRIIIRGDLNNGKSIAEISKNII